MKNFPIAVILALLRASFKIPIKLQDPSIVYILTVG